MIITPFSWKFYQIDPILSRLIYLFHPCFFPRPAPISENPGVCLVSAAVPGTTEKTLPAPSSTNGRTLPNKSIVDSCTQVKPGRRKFVHFTSRGCGATSGGAVSSRRLRTSTQSFAQAARSSAGSFSTSRTESRSVSSSQC